MARRYPFESVKRVFKQHNSRVVTLPWWMLRDMEINRGDYIVWQWDGKSNVVRFFKWHSGVDKEYPDYGNVNLRDQDREKRAEGNPR